ncbi:putative Transcriptional repressor NOT4Hp [Spironucleus salmonicida]|uniref:RNA recognition motif-containing protein n=1 Tax=Spironucleus salmonicida TaxID=348837 RepID=V6LYL2_9EUKA|nr:putative Transcriptional repressor NOT4Hp [Spironucleus salmonicida]|eukprot:EST45909.1 RNA recognition motif-containing protein [Spironucleus salmonicida]
MLLKQFLLLSLQQKQLIRVSQKNLVYVTGLDPSLTNLQLDSYQFFGQYGKLQRITPNKIQGGSQIYVLYKDANDALDCILSISGSFIGGRQIKAQYGTSKYCTHYLQNQKCQLQDCPFLHEFVSQSSEDDYPYLPDNRNLFFDNKKQTQSFPQSWLRVQKPLLQIDNSNYPDDIFRKTAQKLCLNNIGNQLILTGCK